MEVHQVSGHSFDSNIYLVIDKVVVLIDTGTGQHFDLVKQNLHRFGVAPADIELIINTHCHFDHAGGDRDFIRASGCEVAIHELEAELLRKGDQVTTLAGSLFGRRRVEPIKLTRELHDGDRVELGELRLQVLHTPGHTAGSVSLFEPEQRLLFSGDTIFSDGIGRVDLPTGDAKALHASIMRLAKLDVQKMYPGHGPTVEKDAHERTLKIARIIFSDEIG